MQFSEKSKIIFLLQIATVCVFAGRSWQHLFWDAPYRELLWDTKWMHGLVETFTSMSWQEYATSPKTDELIQTGTKTIGWIYLICALFTGFIKRFSAIYSKIILGIGAFLLVFLAILYTKEKFYSIAQFLEYSAQFCSPIFLYYFLYSKKNVVKIAFWIKIVVALTFICHGLYAVNFYPRPGYFTQMVISILGVSENTAITFLNVAGVLDFVVGIGIFFRGRIEIIILLYAAFWGFFTSVARVWAHFYVEYWLESLDQWLHESIYRFPHFLLPIVAILIAFERKKISLETSQK